MKKLIFILPVLLLSCAGQQNRTVEIEDAFIYIDGWKQEILLERGGDQADSQPKLDVSPTLSLP